MPRAALVESATRRVINLVLLSENQPFDAPEGHALVVLNDTESPEVGGQRKADGTGWLARPPRVVPPTEVVAATIDTRLAEAMADMQQIIDAPAPMTGAQLTSAVKAEARLLRAVVRRLRGDFAEDS